MGANSTGRRLLSLKWGVARHIEWSKWNISYVSVVVFFFFVGDYVLVLIVECNNLA